MSAHSIGQITGEVSQQYVKASEALLLEFLRRDNETNPMYLKYTRENSRRIGTCIMHDLKNLSNIEWKTNKTLLFSSNHDSVGLFDHIQ